jgi:hypothetical protein
MGSGIAGAKPRHAGGESRERGIVPSRSLIKLGGDLLDAAA